MKLNKSVRALVLGAILVPLTGCALGFQEYQNRTAHPNVNGGTVTEYESTKYKVLGAVTAKTTSRSLLGIVVEGTAGHGALWDAAIQKHGNKVTGIKDITSKSEFRALLPLILNEITVTYYGVAVKE